MIPKCGLSTPATGVGVGIGVAPAAAGAQVKVLLLQAGAATGEVSAAGLAEGTVCSDWAHETTMNETAIEANGRPIDQPNLDLSGRVVI
jgi:hypothetical protein